METSATEWDALEVLLAANVDRSHGDSLSEEELVRLVIRFVNAPTLPDYLRLLARDGGAALKSHADASLAAIANTAVAEDTAAQCAQTRADLQAIVDQALSPESLARLTASASRQALLPVFDFDAGGLRIRYRYRSSSLAAVLDHATLLLLDPKLPFGRDLCRCRLGSCGNFFLAIRFTTGRPRREYCCTEHMKDHHDEGAAARVATARSNKAKLNARPRRAKQSQVRSKR